MFFRGFSLFLFSFEPLLDFAHIYACAVADADEHQDDDGQEDDEPAVAAEEVDGYAASLAYVAHELVALGADGAGRG